MSQEKLDWLNVMCLIGDCAKRVGDGWHKVQRIVTADAGEVELAGAWHYRATDQGGEPNHYAGPIPVEDIRRRLFSWKPEERSPFSVTDPKAMLALAREILSGDGDEEATKILAGMVAGSVWTENGKDIVRPRGALSADDPGARLGTFKGGYKVHDFDEWLIRNVEVMLDDRLHASAAGLLREGAQAWVEVSIDPVTTPEGVEFRPQLLSYTSLDGSWASGYSRTVQLSICDNTVSIARGEKGQKIKFKHTSNSLHRVNEAREALSISLAHAAIEEATDAFSAEVAQLTNTTVSDPQWGQFKEMTHPLVNEKGTPLEGRSRSYAINRQAELEKLYRSDPRCAPWAGTAFGVLQTVNTHRHHIGIVKGCSRPMRNMDNAINGVTARMDAAALQALDAVLSR